MSDQPKSSSHYGMEKVRRTDNKRLTGNALAKFADRSRRAAEQDTIMLRNIFFDRYRLDLTLSYLVNVL